MSFAESSGLPGYLQAVREISLGGSYRGAFNRLDIFPAQHAAEFLQEKMDIIEEAFKEGTQGKEILLDAFFAFAVQCVHADREEHESLRAIAEHPVDHTVPEPERDEIADRIEHDHVSQRGLTW